MGLPRAAVACVVVVLCLGAGHAHKVGDTILNGHFRITHVARGEEMPEISHLTKREVVSVFGDKFDLSGDFPTEDDGGAGVAPLQEFLEVDEGMGNGYGGGYGGGHGHHHPLPPHKGHYFVGAKPPQPRPFKHQPGGAHQFGGGGLQPPYHFNKGGQQPPQQVAPQRQVNEAGRKLQEVNYAMPEGYEPYPNKYTPEYKGAGSFGAVFSVVRVSDGSIFAAKLARPNSKKGQQFLNEADVREAQIECDRGQQWAHKHVMNCYQVAVIPSPYPNMYEGIYMVMEDSGKMNLNQAAQKGLITKKGAVQIIWQTISGLNYIRSSFNHIHHDMKSDNIMLKDPERGDFYVKVIDLGGAESCHYDNPHNTGVGTPFYAPPEWPGTRLVDPCDSYDLYALGMMLRDGLFSTAPEQKNRAHNSFLPSCFKGDMPACAREQVMLHFPHREPGWYAAKARELTTLPQSSLLDFQVSANRKWVPSEVPADEGERQLIADAIVFMWHVTQPNPTKRGLMATARSSHFNLFREYFPRSAVLTPELMGTVEQHKAPHKAQPKVAVPDKDLQPEPVLPAPVQAPGPLYAPRADVGPAPAVKPLAVNEENYHAIIGIQPPPNPAYKGSSMCSRTEIRETMTAQGTERRCVYWVDPGCTKEVFDISVTCSFGYGRDMDGGEHAKRIIVSLGDQKFKAGDAPIYIQQCAGYRLAECRVRSESSYA